MKSLFGPLMRGRYLFKGGIMQIKLKTIDIRKPQVNIGVKPFLTVEKTVREMVRTAGALTVVCSRIPSFIGNVQEVND